MMWFALGGSLLGILLFLLERREKLSKYKGIIIAGTVFFLSIVTLLVSAFIQLPEETGYIFYYFSIAGTVTSISSAIVLFGLYIYTR
ncbi:hypothetical protein [Bacillus coahuilensis]|nr:hypothetical protein [Bacillus coahuilensis]